MLAECRGPEVGEVEESGLAGSVLVSTHLLPVHQGGGGGEPGGLQREHV